MKPLSDEKIIASWKKNVHPWVEAVRNGEIESRELVTNNAIIETIVNKDPDTVLDVGCGEGWLVRELGKVGINALGIDAVPELIEYAQRGGGGRFKNVSFEDLSVAVIREKFDIVVGNFSLLGDKSVIHLFQQAPLFLNNGGVFIVQTIHPIAGCGDEIYEDGWRAGSWAGFSDQFCEPAPWYFRTLESWKHLFSENGFILSETLEPLNKQTNTPASVIFVGALLAND